MRSPAPLVIHVSPDHPGGALAALEVAREEIRRLKRASGLPAGGITVELAAGTYELQRAFELTVEDSGTGESPIVWQSAPGEHVRLTGAVTVANFAPVTDAEASARFDEGVRPRVLQADLRALGIADVGDVVTAGQRLELFLNGCPMPVSRWPRKGFERIVAVTDEEPVTTREGWECSYRGKFTYEGQRPARWVGERHGWLFGYWCWDWSCSYEKLETVEPQARMVSLVPPGKAGPFRPGQPYCAINLLSELTAPGDWALDPDRGILYFLPPEPLEGADIRVSVAPTLISLDGASHVTVRGLALDSCRDMAVRVSGGRYVCVAGCLIRNTGGYGVLLDGGEGHAVVGCDIHDTGEGGVSMHGGDRQTLTPSGHLVENCHIHHFARWSRVYKPAVWINGVGGRIRHCLIHDAPHVGILLTGNDHLIEYNEVHDVCRETGDVGAFYMGRDWSERGTVLRHNFFHHIRGVGAYGARTIYLDDAASGTTVVGNVFYRCERAAFIGGGRDNLFENNLFVECEPAVDVDARGLNWMAPAITGALPEDLAKVPYQSPPWSERYPELLTVLDDEPGAPKGNVFRRNITQGGRWADVEDVAKPYIRFRNHLIDSDLRIADVEGMDFTLREDSPAWALGFEPIPFGRIGLYEDELRAALPRRRAHE